MAAESTEQEAIFATIVTRFSLAMASYVLDSSLLSLDEFCLRSNSRNWMPDVRGKGRDVIDALRTVYWFHGLRLRLGDTARSLRAMERHLEPNAFRISKDGVPYQRNKWRSYRIGKHTPLDSLVTAMEALCEGTRIEFSHVLWDVLRTDSPISPISNELIQRLEPTVQTLFWERRVMGKIRRRIFDKRTLEVLERRAGLDALAGLTLLLRETHERRDSQHAFELGYRLCRMLVLVSFDLLDHGIGYPLFDFFHRKILPLAAHQGLYQTYASVHFLDLADRLSYALNHINGVEAWRLDPGELRKHKQKVLGWNYGWDYFHLFSPVEVPVDDSLQESDDFLRYWNAQCALRQWGWDGIYSPTARTDGPPSELLRAERTARENFVKYQSDHASRS